MSKPPGQAGTSSRSKMIRTAKTKKYIQNNGNCLIEAVQAGNLQKTKKLIDAGVDVNVAADYGNGWTPLICACILGSVPIVKLLIERGANVNKLDTFGFTPLHYAIGRGFLPIVELLSEGGADLDKSTTDSGITYLLVACNDLPIAQYIIERGADVNKSDNYGMIPLHYACEEALVDVAQLLIKNGSEVNKTDNDGSTPLHRACYNSKPTITRLLIEEGADVHIADNEGNLPFHIACLKGHLEVAQVLIDNDLDVNGNWKRYQ